MLKEIEAVIGRPLCERFNLIFGTSTGAIIAALVALGMPIDDIHTLYKEHLPRIMKACTKKKKSEALKSLADKVFSDKRFEDVKTGLGMEQLRLVLFKQIATVRINDTFERPEMATDLMEHNLTKLNMLYQRGRESFAKHEEQLKEFLL